VRGEVRVVGVAPSGASVTVFNLRDGDSANLAPLLIEFSWSLGLSHHPARLICDRSAILLTLSYDDARALMKDDPAIFAAIARELARLQLELVSRFYELTTLDVRGRLLGELLRLSRAAAHVDGEVILRPAPTHAALGLQVAAAREAVSRALLDLERENLITVGRREIVIRDLAALQQLDEATAGRRFFNE
jgi:CRP-like cAMP-binding protein